SGSDGSPGGVMRVMPRSGLPGRLLSGLFLALLFALALTWPARTLAEDQTVSAQRLYQQHCASCHGEQRFGGTGPALLPESLGRIKRDQATDIIANGRPASQMLAFADVLDPADIDALVECLYTPADQPPDWTAQDIAAHHQMLDDTSQADDTPVHDADPMNLFVVVESGNYDVHIMDGDRFEIVSSFESHFALHGGPKFTPDGRYVYFASRDGWISKYDLHRLTMVAETRAGLNTRNLAVSSDGRWVMVGNYLPGNLVLLDARDLSLLDVIPARGQDGTDSRVSAVYTSPDRESFVVALKDTPEVWEFGYARGRRPDTEPRRIIAQDLLDDFSFTPEHRYLLATSRKAHGGQVIDMESGEVVIDIPLPGMPLMGSGIYWEH